MSPELGLGPGLQLALQPGGWIGLRLGLYLWCLGCGLEVAGNEDLTGVWT